MRIVTAIATHLLVARWRSLVAWSTGLLMLSSLQLAVYPSVRDSARDLAPLLDRYPPALREAFGLDTFSTGTGFLHAELFSVLAPLVLIGVSISTAAAGTAQAEATGTADLLFTGIATRTQVLLGASLATLAAVLTVATSLLVTLAVGTQLVDLQVSFSRLLAAVVMLVALALVFGAVTVLAGAATGQRGVAVAIGLSTAVLAFVVTVLAEVASWLGPLQQMSPFTWDVSGRPVQNGVDFSGGLVSLAVTAVFLMIGAVTLSRRDIRTR